MQPVHNYNLLIIGRSGSGKSATTKLLTSNPSIRVANSLKEVTTEVNYYDGTSFEVAGQQVRFRILDIPGLDKINNRAVIRENILEKLQKNNIALHAIVYVSSLTERDTMDESKLFGFLEQLPWSTEQKKSALIPLLTKYDNLIIDSQEEDVTSTKREFQDIFDKSNYHTAWSKRIYWINQTKSLEFKIKSYEQIRQKYQKQVERLIEMIKRNKSMLTAKAIRDVIESQDRFILKRLFASFQAGQVSFKKDLKSHDVILKVQVEPHSIEESFTAVSASSIGIFISKVCQKEVSTSFSFILMGVPIAIALLKLATESFVFFDKKVGQGSSGESIIRSYEHICSEINKQMEREWQILNESLEFKIINNCLICRIEPDVKFKFFSLEEMALKCEGVQFERNLSQKSIQFTLVAPNFKQETIWNPEISIWYEMRKFNEEEIMKSIEKLRKQFCSKI